MPASAERDGSRASRPTPRPSGAGTPGTGGSRPNRLRRWTGALPVLATLVVAAAIALAVSPGLRHQLGLSFTRQHQNYIELYFADERTARDCPVTTEGAVEVRAEIRSHLQDPEQLRWTVQVSTGSGDSTGDSAGAGSGTATDTGTVDTRPGTATAFTASVPAPTGSYTTTVTLDGRPERLVLHC